MLNSLHDVCTLKIYDFTYSLQFVMHSEIITFNFSLARRFLLYQQHAATDYS